MGNAALHPVTVQRITESVAVTGGGQSVPFWFDTSNYVSSQGTVSPANGQQYDIFTVGANNCYVMLAASVNVSGAGSPPAGLKGQIWIRSQDGRKMAITDQMSVSKDAYQQHLVLTRPIVLPPSFRLLVSFDQLIGADVFPAYSYFAIKLTSGSDTPFLP